MRVRFQSVNLFWMLLLAWVALIVGAALLHSGNPVRAGDEPSASPKPSGPSLRLGHDPGKGKNLDILLITMDTTRRDHLGCYGDVNARTPTIDRIASEGTRFDRAVASVPLTLPSHTTMMTGLQPARHGLHTNDVGALPATVTTLAEYLQAAGYRTAAFVSAFVLHRQYGLDQGFDVYDDEVNRTGEELPFLVSERKADQTTEAVLKWADAFHGPENYFLWVHYYDPHKEYEPPLPYREIFASRPYDGEIAFMDAEIGNLIRGLQARGMWANTLVVMAGDHGEGLGEHGEPTHGILIYDTTMRVPFIMSPPEARTPRPRSPWHERVIDSSTRLVDLMPTVLDLVGASIPDSVDGRSLVPLVEETRPESPPAAYGESYQSYVDYSWARLHAWREGRWKYIHGTSDELYDVESDPGERTNRASSDDEEVQRLKAALSRYLARAARSAVPTAPAALDRESQERLRSLGYLGGGAPAVPDTGAIDLDGDRVRPDPTRMIAVYTGAILPALESIRQHDPEGARIQLTRVLAEDPTNRMCAFNLASCELDLGNTSRAREILERIVRENPGWERPIRSLARVADEQGDTELAIDLMRRAISIQANNPEAHEGLGNFLRKGGDLAGAIAEYRLAVDQDPGLTSSHFNLGLVHEETGRPDLAADEYRAALRSDPDHLGSLENLAKLYVQSSPAGRAIPLYEHALDVAPDSIRVRLLEGLGNAESSLGNHEVAARAFEQAIALQPRDAQLHYMLGCSLGFMGQRKEAIREWRQALAIDPRHEAARLNLQNSSDPSSPSGS